MCVVDCQVLGYFADMNLTDLTETSEPLTFESKKAYIPEVVVFQVDVKR